MKIVSRSDAIKASLSHYFTGKPCKNGHVDRRCVRSFRCLACGRQWATVPKVLEQQRMRYRALRGAAFKPQKPKSGLTATEFLRDWRSKNRESVNKKQRIWRALNKERMRTYAKDNRNRNRHKIYAGNARRRALKRGQLCACCTQSQIAHFYARAQKLGSHQVDHKLPIALGGLHCLRNMQILSIEEHKAKTKIDWETIRARNLAELRRPVPR